MGAYLVKLYQAAKSAGSSKTKPATATADSTKNKAAEVADSSKTKPAQTKEKSNKKEGQGDQAKSGNVDISQTSAVTRLLPG